MTLIIGMKNILESLDFAPRNKSEIKKEKGQCKRWYFAVHPFLIPLSEKRVGATEKGQQVVHNISVKKYTFFGS